MILFQAVSGLVGGTGRVLDPTGASLGLPTDWLAGSPFGSYLIPGIILFTVLGLYPVAAWFCHLPALDRGVAGRSFGRRRTHHLDWRRHRDHRIPRRAASSTDLRPAGPGHSRAGSLPVHPRRSPSRRPRPTVGRLQAQLHIVSFPHLP